MNIQGTVTFLAIGAATLLLARTIREGSGGGTKAAGAPVASVVEETLHKHEGEDSPFVHAFEEALAHKSH